MEDNEIKGGKKIAFPPKLDQLTFVKSLGGGTNSTYLVKDHNTKNTFVFKYGSSEQQLKVELLMNALYTSLGVPTPQFKAYQVVPETLNADLKLPNRPVTIQLSEFIKSASTQESDVIRTQVAKNFIIHAFLGNLDVTKEDNFIQSEKGEVYIIDSGANFIYRALGELREEPEALVTELQSMRDPAINKTGTLWFGSLSEEDIREQVSDLISKRDVIEQTLWDLTSQLEFPTSLQNKVISGFSERLDFIAQHYGFASQPFAKRDKAAIGGNTAAGIMTLSKNDKGELCALLSKRVRHEWYDIFGGNSDKEDRTLPKTAQREVKEESDNQLNYSNLELSRASFHDMVTQTEYGQHLYRIYFIERDEPLDLNALHDSEHTEHRWVPIKELLNATQANRTITAEGQTTVTVHLDDNNAVTLFPPFYELLKQPPVQTLMEHLDNAQKQPKTHTLGVASNLPEQKTSYKPLTTPDQVRVDIINTLLKKGRVLDDIKHHRHFLFQSEKVKKSEKKPALSQSELHLKTIMGDDFKEDKPIKENVLKFLTDYFDLKYSEEEEKRLVMQATQMIENERAHPDRIFFYHGCDSEIAYAYSLYTNLYQILNADSQAVALRTDNALFHKILNINEFIEHFLNISNNGKVYNYDEGFMETAISTNVFLFGNHKLAGSNTIIYYTKNKTAVSINIKTMLESSLQVMGISDDLIQQAVDLAQESPYKMMGTVFQFSLPLSVVDQYSYASLAGARLNPVSVGEERTIKLSDIIKHMRTGDIDKNYIASLQARVMLPPGIPIKNHEYKWGKEPSTDLKQSFEQKLSRLSENMAYDVLLSKSPLNKLNSKTALVRYLPEIMAQAGLSVGSETISDDLLLLLIDSNDYESIKVIISLFPQFKDKEIEVRDKSYRKYKIDKNKTQTLLEILLGKVNSGHLIKHIYGDDFYEGKLDTLDFSQVLGAISKNKQLEFLNLHGDRVKNENDLIKALQRMHPEYRWQFLKKNEHMVQHDKSVGLIMKTLAHDERLEFFNNHRDTIHSIEGLTALLDAFPEKQRLGYANQYQDLIKSGYDLQFILAALPEKDRLGYAIDNKNKIGQFIFLLELVLNTLPTTPELYELIEPFEDKMSNGFELGAIISHLMNEKRADFAKKYQDKIRNGSELSHVVKYLPKKCQLDFAKAHQQKIENGNQLAEVIEVIPGDEQLDFAKTLHTCVQNIKELKKVLNVLPGDNRLEFVMLCLPILSTEEDLNSINALLPGKENEQILRTQFEQFKTSPKLK
ncbi:NUDIX hydrolase [Legionella shakespearei]|uniref:Ankyrin n=1 Tax=Legionella shakespearei DSM 23087 TaxID=1122169 RepID=A0A0W0Z7K7_9GAMM|nr:NUDIX hydrolase [Legionella shakespearei]KTD65113.1 ankyrin [Legionella shakespearei DSM 23087]